MRKIGIISFTKAGSELSERMAEILKEEYDVRQYTTKKTEAQKRKEVFLVGEGLKNWCGSAFFEFDGLIFIGACGIAVRTVAPFLRSKTEDPAVLVSDERGRNIISLLSGHLGGGNELTEYLAGKLGANPVITTASDVNGRIAIDVWAKKNRLTITDMELAKKAAAGIVAGERIPFYCDGHIRGPVPEELRLYVSAEGIPMPEESAERVPVPDETTVGCCVSEKKEDSEDFQGRQELSLAVSVYTGWGANVLHLVPRAVVMGIGCKRGKSCEEIRTQAESVLRKYHVAPESICKIVSIDIKAEEPGLCELAGEWSVPFETFSAEELRRVPGDYGTSEFVRQITGVDNVCERAAMAALPGEEQDSAKFICRKTAADGVTIALLCREWSVSFE